MLDYSDYLDDNREILNYIVANNIEDYIISANDEAINLANIEGKQFLHSYRYSKIYDMLNENKLDKSKVFKIVGLLENSYEKSISELVNDFNANDMELN